ncbi:MAG: hypothetical protein R3B06_24520 [Kofleriaceae bacterium]
MFVVGTFSGSATLGGQVVQAAGGTDVFLAKYTPSGTRLWTKRYGSTGLDSGLAVAATADGGVAVAGQFAGIVDFGTGPLTASANGDGFVAAIDATGETRWVHQASATGMAVFSAITTNSSGDVFTAGRYSGTATIGATSHTAVAGDDVLLVKYTSAGTLAWSKSIGGTGGDNVGGLATIGDDPVLSGQFSLVLDVGGGAMTAAGSTDVFVVRLDSALGGHLWSVQFGGTNTDLAKGVVSTGSGVAVVGCYSSSAAFGGPTLTSAGMYDAFVVSLSNSGATSWAKSFGGAGSDCANVAVGQGGDVLASGGFALSSSFDGTILTSVGGQDVWVTRLDGASGDVAFARQGGGAAYDFPTGIAVSGSYFDLSGNTGGAPTMFGHQLVTSGMMDGFLIQSQQ